MVLNLEYEKQELENALENGGTAALLEKKIELYERIIRDSKEYVEYEGYPILERYRELKKIASQKDPVLTQEIHEWKKPIEHKIEESQAKLESESPATIERKMKNKKREFYRDIVGSKDADEIRAKRKSDDDELEQLRKAAKKINPRDTSIIEAWNLTEEQRDEVIVQSILDGFYYGENNNKRTAESLSQDITTLKQIRDKYSKSEAKVEESEAKRRVRQLLSSGRVQNLIDAYNRRFGIDEQNIEEKMGEQK